MYAALLYIVIYKIIEIWWNTFKKPIQKSGYCYIKNMIYDNKPWFMDNVNRSRVFPLSLVISIHQPKTINEVKQENLRSVWF